MWKIKGSVPFSLTVPDLKNRVKAELKSIQYNLFQEFPEFQRRIEFHNTLQLDTLGN